MKRPFLAVVSLSLMLAAPAFAQRAGGDPRAMTPVGNPSALVAAELAFARLAQEKGQWTAFDATADDEAEMFVPQRTLARPWLKKRANPPQAVQWQAQKAWVSCDGSAGVTYGAYQAPGGGNGWFSTVWKRDRKGQYKWVLDQGADLASPLPAADWLEGKVADCPTRPRRPEGEGPTPPRPQKGPPPMRPLAGPIPPVSAPQADNKDGQANDGSLAWRSTVQGDGSRVWTVWMWKDGQMGEVLHLTAKAG